MTNYKTVEIKKLPDDHLGNDMGYMVKSTCLENCQRRVRTERYAEELAEYWESVAMSCYA